MKKKTIKSFLASLMVLALISGCAASTPSSSAAQESSAPASEQSASPDSEVAEKKELVPPSYSADESFSKGPNGEDAASATIFKLTDEEKQQIKDGGFKVALSFHDISNEFASAELEAMKSTFESLGIEIVGVTDAGFKVEQQVSDIESLLALQPDVLLSTPVDPISTEAAYRSAISKGSKIVFMENIGANMTAGNDYVTCIAADNYGNGVAAADIMAQALGEQGNVGIIFYDSNFFVTTQRSDGFRDTINKKYPNMKVVAEGGFTDPNKVTEVADGMLANNPDIDGVFAAWDVPAEGVIAAAVSSGRDDLIITTIDLGQNAAKMIAQDGMIRGVGAQRPYDQGVALAMASAYAMLDKEVPPFITVPPLPVVKANLLDSYWEAYHTDAPKELSDILK